MADDPYRGLIASRTSDPARQGRPRELLEANPRVEGLGIRAPRVLDAYCDFNHPIWENRMSSTSSSGIDLVANELIAVIEQCRQADRLPAAHRLLAVSPDSPYAKTYLIKDNFHNVRQYAEAWEKEAAHQPAVLAALGNHIEDGKLAATEACLKAALSMAPEEPTYSQLAVSLLRRNWAGKNKLLRLATLEVLKRCGGGSNDAGVRQAIALHFMEHRAISEGRALRRGSRQEQVSMGLLDGRGLPKEGLQESGTPRGRTSTTPPPRLRTCGCFGTASAGGPATAGCDTARQMAREFIKTVDPATADPNLAQHYHDCAAVLLLLEDSSTRRSRTRWKRASPRQRSSPACASPCWPTG